MTIIRKCGRNGMVGITGTIDTDSVLIGEAGGGIERGLDFRWNRKHL